MALGRRAAAAILAARRGDGYDFEGTYTFTDGPGEYQTTPPFGGFVFRPGFRFATPFALSSPHRLRPNGPPALGSRPYAAAFGIRHVGGWSSSSRRVAGYVLARHFRPTWRWK